MRLISLTLIQLIISLVLVAQSPQSFSYQAVVRDATGNIIADGSVSLRISILTGSPQGQSVYTETHFTTTNQFGLIAVSIGQGITTFGLFDTIPWNIGTYFIQIELDATGGANYTLMGTSQILSVPYALYGRDEDFDSINELQNLTFASDTLSLSKANKVEIPLGYLGELRMFAVSIPGAITKQALQQRGWAICNGTTPESQGISNAILTTTPDMTNRFVKMGNDETSGNTGGKAMVRWATNNGNDKRGMANVTTGGWDALNSSYDINGNKTHMGNFSPWYGDWYTETNEPPFYEALFFIKVK